MKFKTPVFLIDPLTRHPVRGISFKKTVRLYAETHKNIVYVKLNKEFVFYASRIGEILSIFDKLVKRFGDKSGILARYDFSRTSYWIYRAARKEKWRKANSGRIKDLFRLYRSIKKKGMLSVPVVAEHGFLVEGQHRLSILAHLGRFKNCSINYIRYSDCFTRAESKSISKAILKYRKIYVDRKRSIMKRQKRVHNNEQKRNTETY